MIDRGIIKWQPFNSCFSSQQIINDITSFKNKKDFPELSEDQINLISEKIKDAYILNINVTIEYFYDGAITTISGKINNINTKEKRICLNNKYIYFKQILKICY